ncbi:MAG TPA: ATP-dependent 6-phosphofructokinase [Ilumatobacteraceae bacterium]|nr:ATP-dependent 6-phosphofructokinase [Ilumatobacteraceae bacterium]
MDRTEELVGLFHEAGIDALITIGGDGSLTLARRLSDAGLRVIGVPKSIDNDLAMTDTTFGFDTAVGVATECIDRLFTTATSHSRVFVVEVMGRYAGWIALNSGTAAGAHAILIPEIPFKLEPVAAMIARREERGARFAIVVVAEGARPLDGQVSVIGKSVGQQERLGGMGLVVATELERLTGKEARTVVLGHLLRGGTPTSLDRLLGIRFGAAAVRGLEMGHRGVMVALVPPSVQYVPLVSAVARMHSVPLDCDTIISGRDLGISFGD